jgi:hypothetical protein
VSERTHEDDADWFFFDGGPGAPRYGDDPTKHAVDHDTESFVREVLQNANDQRRSRDRRVEVTFRIVELSGADLESFLNSLGWDDTLRERIAAVAESEHGRGYERFLARFDGDDPKLRLVVIEDRNTTGLTGSWDEDSNYSALVRDELYSSKRDDTAGGSYGLGKSVLWTFSGASTVVFNSRPEDAETADTPTSRLIARTKLPTHRLASDGPEYQGAGWFCRLKRTDDGPRPSAVRGEPASRLAEELHVSRAPGTGTSVMVVGFRDPTRDTRPTIPELADEFVEATVRYFWPALYAGDLHVEVETPQEARTVTVDDIPSVRPFVECYAARYDGEGSLNAPGDVAGLDVDIDLPPRSDGEPTPDGSVRLAARLASPADDDTHLNEVALFRGTGMVVKYYDQSRVAFSDRDFFGVLACGTARAEGESTDGDREIDRFLRFAEPPEHDDWVSTENLRNEYQRGFRTALDDTFQQIRRGLRQLVARQNKGGALSDEVLKKFPIHGDGRRRTASPTTLFELEGEARFNSSRWTFSGSATPVVDDPGDWTAEVSLTRLGEDGAGRERIPVDYVNSTGATTEVEDGVCRIVGDGPGRVTFQGQSVQTGDPDGSEDTVGRVQMEVEASLAIDRGDES